MIDGAASLQTLELAVARVCHHLVLRIGRLRHEFILGRACGVFLNDALKLIVHVSVDGLWSYVAASDRLLVLHQVLALVSSCVLVVDHVALRVTNRCSRLLAGTLRNQASLEAKAALTRRVIRCEIHLLLLLHVTLQERSSSARTSHAQILMIVSAVLFVETDVAGGHQLLLHGHALILLRRLVTRLALVLRVAVRHLLRRPRSILRRVCRGHHHIGGALAHLIVIIILLL